MKKRVITLFMAAIMVVACAFPAFAASGLNADEENLLGQFTTVVESWKGILGDNLAAQYEEEAERALTQVDLDKAACDELGETIGKVDELLKSSNVATKTDAEGLLPQVLEMVNAVSTKYGMTVSVDSRTASTPGYAHVTINLTTEDGEETKAGDDDDAVNQTGVNMTATYTVIALLAVALVAGVVMVKKNNLVGQN